MNYKVLPISAVVSCALFLGVLPVYGGDTWAGSTSTSMNTASNWSPSGVPAPADSLTFPSSASRFLVNNDISNPFVIGGLVIDSTTPYTIQSTLVYGFSMSGISMSGISIEFVDTVGGHTLTLPMQINGNIFITDATTTTSNTIGGSISGPGSIFYEGTTKLVPLILSGSNSYSGGTTIASGALKLSASPNALGSGTVTFNNGDLEIATGGSIPNEFITTSPAIFYVDTGYSPLLTGQISGPSSVTITTTTISPASAPGYLTYENTTSYQGATNITGATLQLSGAGNLPMPPQNLVMQQLVSASDIPAILITNDPDASIVAVANLMGDPTSVIQLGNDPSKTFMVRSVTGTAYDGTITGNWTFEMNGVTPSPLPPAGAESQLTCTGPISVGNTIVQSGTLIINGSLTSPVTTVEGRGAVLRGTGTITGNVIVNPNGVYYPGNSPLTQMIVGNYTTSGIHVVEIEGGASPNANTAIVSENVTINPATTLQVIVDAGTYTTGMQFDVIDYAGTETGLFSTVVNLPAFYYVFYLPGRVVIEAGESLCALFSQDGYCPNVRSLGCALDQMLAGSCLNNQQGLQIVLAELFTLGTPGIYNALFQMQPSLFGGLTAAQERNSVSVRQTVWQRMQQSAVECSTPGTWNVWVDGFASFMNQSRSSCQFGFHDTTGGGVFGMDARCTESVYCGFITAYTYTKMNWHGHGVGNINSAYGGVYGGVHTDHFLLTSMLMGAFNRYETTRYIRFADFNQAPHAGRNGGEVFANLGLEGIIHAGCVKIRPEINLDYAYLRQNSFKERNGWAFNLAVDSNNANYLRTEAGIHVASCFRFGAAPQPDSSSEQQYWGSLTPDVSFAYARETRWRSKYHSHFGQTCQTFSVNGFAPNRNLWIPGVSLTGSFCRDLLTATLEYEAELGHQYTNQTCNLQFKWAW